MAVCARLALMGLVLLVLPSVAPVHASHQVSFSKWLFDLQIPLPAVTVIKGVDLTDGVCTHTVIANISTDVQGLAYGFEGSGISLNCSLAFKAEALPRFNERVTMVVDHSILGFVLQLEKDDQQRITNLTLEQPTAIFEVSNMIVDGTIPTGGFFNSSMIRTAMADVLQAQFRKLVPDLVDHMLAPLLRNISFALYAQGQAVMHRPPPCPHESGMADLRTSPVIQLVEFVNSILSLNDTDSLLLDGLVDALTNHTGRVALDLNLSTVLDLPGLGTVGLGFQDVVVAGLDTWNSIELFNVTSPCQLETTSNLANLSINISLTLDIQLANSSDILHEEFTVVFAMDHGTMDLILDLDVSQAKTDALRSLQIFQPGCLAEAVDFFGLTFLNLDFQLDDLELVPAAGTLEQDLDLALNNLMHLVVVNFDDLVPMALNVLLNETLAPINKAINQSLSNQTCTPARSTAPPGTNMTITYIAVSTGLALAFVFGLWVFHANDKHAKRLSAYSLNSPDESAPLLEGRNPAPCLAAEPSVGTWSRYLIPITLLGTIALLINSNASAGASVYPFLIIGNDRYRFDPTFTFSLINTVHDMWQAHVRPLSVVIALFSGVWPYLKLVLMLTAWIMPVRWLGESSRETLLRVLDALGKWSLIDTYVMVMMLVAFRFRLPLLPADMETEKDTSLDIFVQPDVGLYTFVLATIISLIMGHIILHMHRKAADQHRQPTPDHLKRSFGNHVFVRDDITYRFTRCGYFSILLLLLATIAILLVGSVMYAFSFNFKGLAAAGLDLEHDLMGYNDSFSYRNYSLGTLGTAIPESSIEPNSFLTRMLQATFYIFAIVMPCLHVLVMITVWVVPLSVNVQARWYTIAEVLNAWSALDVFVVSILAAILQIQRFALFIIGDYCDGINKIIQQLQDEGQLPHDYEAKCFDVIATLDNGCWFLFSAMLLSFFTAAVVMPLCHRALQDRLHSERSTKLHTVNSMGQTPSEPRSCQCFDMLSMGRWLGLVQMDDVFV